MAVSSTLEEEFSGVNIFSFHPACFGNNTFGKQIPQDYKIWGSDLMGEKKFSGEINPMGGGLLGVRRP